MKILVCGTRQFNNYELLKNKLDEFVIDFLDNNIELLLISGGAQGADTMAKQYAKEKNIKFLEILADWKKDGKSAGYKRNLKMLEHANMVIAFWDGHSPGTKHTITEAEKRKLPCFVIKYSL